MLENVATILAVLMVFSGCISSIQRVDNYDITGEIIDPDTHLTRLFEGMRVSATNHSTGTIYAGTVSTEDAVSCRYSVKNLPSGDYTLAFSSPHYEPAEYSLSLNGDRTLDVTLKPRPLFSLGVEELHFESRVTTREFSITNTTGKAFSLDISPSNNIALLLRRISDFQKMNGTIGWRCHLDAGETKSITVEIQHDDKESLLEGSLFIAVDGLRLFTLPLVIETTNRDFYANLVGQVTDEQGHPLKNIPIYCNCTDTIVMTDEDGRYSFEDLPYISLVQVTALSEFYNWKTSEFKKYVLDEIKINLTLERCRNHLVLDCKEIDFGTGSISSSTNPVTFEINVSAETNAPVSFIIMTKVVGGKVYPGLNYLANGMFQSSQKLWFQLDRRVGDLGDFQFTAILKTDCAGVYLIPIKFSNTE